MYDFYCRFLTASPSSSSSATPFSSAFVVLQQLKSPKDSPADVTHALHNALKAKERRRRTVSSQPPPSATDSTDPEDNDETPLPVSAEQEKTEVCPVSHRVCVCLYSAEIYTIQCSRMTTQSGCDNRACSCCGCTPKATS